MNVTETARENLRHELEQASDYARRKFREDKVRHLCWYLIDSPSGNKAEAFERAVELAREIRLTDEMIKQ